MDTTVGASFFSLTPDRVLDAVEVGGLRSTGRCLPLRAFENRVYEVELTDESRLVVKFYRPGRWTREAVLDEHRFLAELA
jgi:Ser/Thr protein kinase RdoA (MazF antagonist)